MYQTQSYHLRIPDNASYIIIDAASLSAERNIDDLIRQSDIIVVPMLPSSIDIRAGSKFIAELLTHRDYRRNPLPVAVVANRTRPKTVAYDKLFNFLQCLDVPTVASFTDATAYTVAAEHGTGIHDVNPTGKMAGELEEWEKLIAWIDAQTFGGQLRRSAPIRASIRERIAARTANR